MKKKIVWKLAVLFTLILLLFTAVMGMVFVVLFRQHTQEVNRDRMVNRALSVSETIAAFQYGHELVVHGEEGFDVYLEFLDELAVEEVWITDENGEIVSIEHGHEYEQPEELEVAKEIPGDMKEMVNDVLQGKDACMEGVTGKERTYLTVGVPIYLDDGSISGAVLLRSPMSGLNDAVRYALSALFIGSAAAMVFSVGASVFLSWYFTKPLRKMRDTALKLAEGEYTAKTQINQQDEIGELALTMDFLADRLEQAESDRKALDQMKEDFVANVSHELRTPVAVLRGSLEVLCDKTVEDEQEIENYHHQMLLESRHMERLVNDLLDLSRLQNVGFQLEKSEVDLMDVVRDSVRAVRRTAAERNLPVVFAGEEDSYEIWGDYVRIRQMLIVLLDNAIKFADEGSTIEVGLSNAKEGTLLWVKDQGQTIAEEDIPHIFERFHKTCSVKNAKGTGLGLPIAQQIAKRHDAVVKVESGQQDTKFSICFHTDKKRR